MANQMQPTTKGAGPAWIYAFLVLVIVGTGFLRFCGSTVEGAFKQADEIGACLNETDACNAPPAPIVPDLATLPTNPNGTSYGLCVAGIPDAAGNLPPGADFDASNAAPPQCITVQSPSGGMYPAYVWNQTEASDQNDGGRGWRMNWGTFLRVFLFLLVIIFGWFFWGKWRRAKRDRKQLATLGTQPVDPATGGPKLPVPVPVPGAPVDDDFDDDDDDEMV